MATAVCPVLQVRRPAADCGPGAVSAVSSNSGRRNILLFTRGSNFYIDVHLIFTTIGIWNPLHWRLLLKTPDSPSTI